MATKIIKEKLSPPHTTTGRDLNGRFAPGHRLSANLKRSTGQKVGRPKTIAGKVLDALQIAQDAMPKLIQDMIRDAQNPKVSVAVRQQCREFLVERIYGKANQPIAVKADPRKTFVFTMPDGTQATAREAYERSIKN